MDHIRFQNLTLNIRATKDTIELHKTSTQPLDEPIFLQLPEGNWKATLVNADGFNPRGVTLGPNAPPTAPTNSTGLKPQSSACKKGY